MNRGVRVRRGPNAHVLGDEHAVYVDGQEPSVVGSHTDRLHDAVPALILKLDRIGPAVAAAILDISVLHRPVGRTQTVAVVTPLPHRVAMVLIRVVVLPLAETDCPPQPIAPKELALVTALAVTLWIGTLVPHILSVDPHSIEEECEVDGPPEDAGDGTAGKVHLSVVIWLVCSDAPLVVIGPLWGAST